MHAVHVPLVDYIDHQQAGVEAVGEADGRIENVAGVGGEVARSQNPFNFLQDASSYLNV
ncbi:hypothetical protein [Desulfosarcina sp.]|uniref:hypothetical protein n=1 Tax=Desulfosarcina sp. TaxID=2027861 RepID=UPI0029A60133|nr:hypothetical protein [Desulfosarcina sp.]MDX2451324.1 hypothetical protein [Desulfosarcina sp.]MDX2489148.1 hypothetical protein [Desulfosarcina sp.]